MKQGPEAKGCNQEAQGFTPISRLQLLNIPARSERGSNLAEGLVTAWASCSLFSQRGLCQRNRGNSLRFCPLPFPGALLGQTMDLLHIPNYKRYL